MILLFGKVEKNDFHDTADVKKFLKESKNIVQCYTICLEAKSILKIDLSCIYRMNLILFIE